MKTEGALAKRRSVDIAIAGVCFILAVVTMALHETSEVAGALQRSERVNVLLIGSDYNDHARHSDTMMFVSYDPQSRFLDVLSIPRDTNITIPGLPRINRVNQIFTYEFKRSGRDFASASTVLKSQIETLLSSGTVPVSIPYYLTIDYGGFRNFIDAIGGVYITVTEPMDYDDNWGKLHIHFQPGRYLMQGEDALHYVRYRGKNADQGRVLRQQIFIKEVLKRFKNPAVLFRLGQHAKLLLGGFHTNMTLWDLASVALEGRRVRFHDTRLWSLPGHVQGNLWKIDSRETQRLILMMQMPAASMVPRIVSQNAEQRGRSQPSSVTVEVWNASGRPMADRLVMRFLREQGFDVVKYGNYGTRQQRTLVMDRSGRLRPAQAVADSLSAAVPEVVSRVDTARQVDVSVIVGRDFPLESLKKR